MPSEVREEIQKKIKHGLKSSISGPQNREESREWGFGGVGGSGTPPHPQSPLWPPLDPLLNTVHEMELFVIRVHNRTQFCKAIKIKVSTKATHTPKHLSNASRRCNLKSVVFVN